MTSTRISETPKLPIALSLNPGVEKPQPPEFEEGNWRGWATVIGAWVIQFCTFGYTNAFGVYQDFYVREYLSNNSSSQISWIGSVQVMLLFSVGLFSGRAFDRGYFYHLTITGAILLSVCMFMLSLTKSHHYYQIFLSQGLGSGIAFGLLYIPAMSVITHHFRRRRALAMGIVTSGSSLGGVLHPIMLNKFFHGSLGFHNGVRASAGLNSGLLLVAVLLMRTRLPPSQASPLGPRLRVFVRDPPYVFAVIGASFTMCGLLIPLLFLQLDAITRNIDPDLAFYLLPILNGTSLVGRVLSSVLAGSLGVFNLIVPCTVACGALVLSLSAARTVAGLVIVSVGYGLFSGAYVSLLAPMLAALSHDVSEIGARMGVCFFFLGIAALIGTPISGVLLSSNFVWWKPFLFSGSLLFVGAALLLVARSLLVKARGTQKL